ncbi:glycosyl transferase family protein [Allostella sp. ATCC 35155]|nr:glycosyl transferase family protein [Stella sp. ATCC 35155]
MSRPSVLVEQADRHSIAGWAFDPDRPDRHVALALHDGPSHVLTFVADGFRDDLREAGLGDGDHAFHVNLPGHLLEQPVVHFRILDPASGEELAAVSIATEEEKLAATRDLLLSKLPWFLRQHEDLRDRARWASAYLPMLMSACVSTYQELRRALEAEAAARREPPPSLEGLGFDRVVEGVLSRFPILEAPRFDEPEVSIVIPVYEKFDFTYACVKSILDTNVRASYEIIVVDDCSKDETLLAPMILQNCRILRNERNQGFVLNCNRGAREARGRYVFLLNNDTALFPDAIDALLDTFRQHDNVGAVGSKLLFGDGKLQEAGGIIWRLGDGWNYGRGQDPEEPRFNYVRPADYISGAALMLPRDLFLELGGFDTHYVPAYYEDTDLAFRVRAAGRRVLYQPRSKITHFEGVSSGTDLTQGAKRYQVVNGRKFFTRWKSVLEQHALNGHQPEREKDRGARFRTLFIDETTPTPKEDAGSNAAVTHMRCLQALGAKVTFVPADNMTHLGAPSTALQDMGVEFLHHPYFWSVEEVLRKRPDEFDLIYLHRFNTADRHLGICRALAPKARIVYNVADLHYLRYEREREVGAPGAKTAAEIAAFKARELQAIRSSDVVLVHSDVEREVLAREGVDHVVVVPWVIEGRPAETSFEERTGLYFIGGFRHAPNIDAVAWFCEEIWPLVRKACPDQTFGIIGSHMPDEVRALERHRGVRCIGFVDELQPVFDQARLTVAPLRYGAGLKGKVALSLAHGVPCVGTAVAYEGFVGDSADLMQVSDDPKGMAKRIATLLTDEARWKKASVSAARFAEQQFSMAAVTAKIRAIGQIGPDAPRQAA